MNKLGEITEQASIEDALLSWAEVLMSCSCSKIAFFRKSMKKARGLKGFRDTTIFKRVFSAIIMHFVILRPAETSSWLSG